MDIGRIDTSATLGESWLHRVSPKAKLIAFALLILGVLAGSMLWWILLCALSSLFRRKLTDNTLVVINRVSGGLIIFFGVVVLISVTNLGSRLLASAKL